MAGNFGVIVVKKIITNSSPLTVVVDLQTTCLWISISTDKSSCFYVYTSVHVMRTSVVYRSTSVISKATGDRDSVTMEHLWEM